MEARVSNQGVKRQSPAKTKNTDESQLGPSLQDHLRWPHVVRHRRTHLIDIWAQTNAEVFTWP